MQTFLPYPDLELSAQSLDWRRLGKQRVECLQILNVLEGTSKRMGWRNHPAVKMWAGHTEALRAYMNESILEWVTRGYNNTMEIRPTDPDARLPEWFGKEDFHASHRSNLIRKDPTWYGQFGWKEGPDLPYVWPERN
jgi:hypothetical protein